MFALLRPAARAEELEGLRSLPEGAAEAFAALYAVHNGFRLYVDPGSGESAVDLVPLDLWGHATEEMRLWLKGCPDEFDPARLKGGIAFGYFPGTADGFAVSVEGPHRGELFLVRHDDSYMPAFASGLGELVERLMGEPVEVLVELLGNSFRCTDEEGGMWIPEVVVG